MASPPPSDPTPSTCSHAVQIIAVPDYPPPNLARKKKDFAVMTAAGGTSNNDVPIIQADNLTSNVKFILYSCNIWEIIQVGQIISIPVSPCFPNAKGTHKRKLARYQKHHEHEREIWIMCF